MKDILIFVLIVVALALGATTALFYYTKPDTVEVPVEVVNDVPYFKYRWKTVEVEKVVTSQPEVEIVVRKEKEYITGQIVRIVKVPEVEIVHHREEIPITVEVLVTPTVPAPVEFFDTDTADAIHKPVSSKPGEDPNIAGRHQGWYYLIRLVEGLYRLSYRCEPRKADYKGNPFGRMLHNQTTRLESIYRHGSVYSLVNINESAGSEMLRVSATNSTLATDVNIGGTWGSSTDRSYDYSNGRSILQGDYYLRLWNECIASTVRVAICKVPHEEYIDERCPIYGFKTGG